MTDKPRSKGKKAEEGGASPLQFHQRFNIAVDVSEAQKRFVNRVRNLIFDGYMRLTLGPITCGAIYRNVAYRLGERWGESYGFDHYTGDGDFQRCLQVVEAAYEKLTRQEHKRDFSEYVINAISMSEVDLGIAWKDGIFTRTGAKILDEGLVNEPLQWLRSERKYRNVLEPFEKGLRHYLEATRRQELLADTVTDMYEALEALAKVVTGKPTKDLSANRELFVKKLGLSRYYKKMLEEYISYACEFRHGVEETRERATPSPKEVEAFIYTTGLFIRLTVAEEPSTSSAPGT